MTLKERYFFLVSKINSLQSIPLLMIRLVLAYGFYGPVIMKWKNIHDIADWFATLGIPAPAVNAYLSAGTEALGVILLTLGFGTRIITIPLIITMIVAIKTVHWSNGFEAGNNGYEIPLYYIIMLFTLFVFGPGKWSINYLFNKKVNQNKLVASVI